MRLHHSLTPTDDFQNQIQETQSITTNVLQTLTQVTLFETLSPQDHKQQLNTQLRATLSTQLMVMKS